MSGDVHLMFEHDTLTVRFEPTGAQARVALSTVVSDAAHEAGLSFHLPCGGRGKCGKCRVSIMSGEVSEPTEKERELLDPAELSRGLRLACQTRLLGDAVIGVPLETDVIGTKTLRGDQLRAVPLEPNVLQVPVSLPVPCLEDQRSDLDRLADALAPLKPHIHACPPALQHLPTTLRSSDFSVVASLVDGRLVDVHPGLEPPRTCGVAVDIGTTTVVAYLVDLLTGKHLAAAAAYNQQGRHGADVISRIEYCNREAGGLAELRGLVLETINSAISEALLKCGGSVEDIYEVTVVGNTAMNHLFMGLDPRNLAQAPYIPVSSRPQEMAPQDAGILMHPRGNVFCLPVIAGFVGADTVGVILATDMLRRSEPVLAVDIGTNGEVALWSGERLLVASCAMGPALEGAQIEQGMRAAPGAIERVTVREDDIEIKTIGGVDPVGICGSGLVDAMAALLQLGLVDPSGRMCDGEALTHVPEAVRRRLVGEGKDRAFILGQSGRNGPILLTQKDVRQLQLVKGALRAAVDLLLQFAGLSVEDLGEVLLAGAFGNYIAPRSALRMGLLPAMPLEKIRGVGNAAGAGALLALISTTERERAVELAAAAEHIELSRRPEFQAAFMETMMFPD